ncbi:MAG: hypothetical protein KGI78_02020 [Patescibacteria group bacterium]|nr:hypothetical protein [Patescibacteria group bacterium]MDE1944316.1 hypothetical protein [Patescibacteria group bacterium]MDE1945099.1 hypothetical protein [Patescibacteria group bacterium]MDE2057609.1 hypothetical protein [Patescibacteria group bacterium]
MPPAHETPHYHGDAVRALFIVSAIVLVVSEFMGAGLLSGPLAIGLAVVLAVAAGITNPAQPWIHWVDALLALLTTILFGLETVGDYAAGLAARNGSFIFALGLALLSLSALYLAVRTVRGTMLRDYP